eukprot:gene11766-biopygen3287
MKGGVERLRAGSHGRSRCWALQRCDEVGGGSCYEGIWPPPNRETISGGPALRASQPLSKEGSADKECIQAAPENEMQGFRDTRTR